MNWMAASRARLSGLALGKLETHLIWTFDRGRLWPVEAVDRPPVHYVCADQAGESDGAFNRVLSLLRQSQYEEGDEGDGDLDTDGVFATAKEGADFESLLDPAEKQLDLPSTLVKTGYLVGRSVEIIGENTEDLAGRDADTYLAHRIVERILAAGGEAAWEQADAIR